MISFIRMPSPNRIEGWMTRIRQGALTRLRPFLMTHWLLLWGFYSQWRWPVCVNSVAEVQRLCQTVVNKGEYCLERALTTAGATMLYRSGLINASAYAS